MTYFLAQSGAVFEDPIKADPNWPRVLVIDPEDASAAEAFARAYIEARVERSTPWDRRTPNARDTITDAVQAAFRAMLVEPPSKPDEPTGLGAVVEATAYTTKVRKFVNVAEKPEPGRWSDEDGNGHDWTELADVRVLHEGMPS